MGNSVSSIGDFAFYDCIGLTSISIPYSVIRIEKGAFSGDEGICDIYVSNSTPPFVADANDFVFDDVYECAIVHIPVGSRAVYSSAKGWNRFRNFKEDMAEAIEDIPEYGSTQAKVYAKGNSIVVNGTKGQETIRVYSMDGKLVDSKQGDGEFSLAKGGIYVVKVGEESFKESL